MGPSGRWSASESTEASTMPGPAKQTLLSSQTLRGAALLCEQRCKREFATRHKEANRKTCERTEE